MNFSEQVYIPTVELELSSITLVALLFYNCRFNSMKKQIESEQQSVREVQKSIQELECHLKYLPNTDSTENPKESNISP